MIKVAVTRYNVINERDEMHEEGREGEREEEGYPERSRRGVGRWERGVLFLLRESHKLQFILLEIISSRLARVSLFFLKSEQTNPRKDKRTNTQPCTNKQTRLTGVHR